MAIPKIIHYCWFGGSEIPCEYQKYIDGWKKICPDYEIIKWDESNYDLNKNRFLRKAVKEKKWAFVSDYARLDIVNSYGGIYLDTDVELIRSLDPLLEYKSFWGMEKDLNNHFFISTGLGFGSESGNGLLSKLEQIYQSYDVTDQEIDFIPCPIFQRDVFISEGLLMKNKNQFIGNHAFFASDYFAPMDSVTQKIKITKNTYSIHHYSKSWLTPENKEYFIQFARYSKLFGPWMAERILVIKKKIGRK